MITKYEYIGKGRWHIRVPTIDTIFFGLIKRKVVKIYRAKSIKEITEIQNQLKPKTNEKHINN